MSCHVHIYVAYITDLNVWTYDVVCVCVTFIPDTSNDAYSQISFSIE